MSKIYDKRIVDDLQKLGLTEKESRIYVYLMGRESEVGSSKIVAATKLHGQYVYDALESLEEKGLVKHVLKNNRKKWSSTPPIRIDSLIEEKRIIAHEVRDSLEKIYIRQHDQDFEVFQGQDQFITNEFQMLEEAAEDGFIDIIGGENDRFPEILGDSRRLYNEKSITKNISVRFIGTADQRKYLEVTKESRPNFDFRIMPGFNKSNVSTSVHAKSVLFQVYGEPVLVFKVRSEEIARNYRTFFESLWSLCPHNS